MPSTFGCIAVGDVLVSGIDKQRTGFHARRVDHAAHGRQIAQRRSQHVGGAGRADVDRHDVHGHPALLERLDGADQLGLPRVAPAGPLGHAGPGQQHQPSRADVGQPLRHPQAEHARAAGDQVRAARRALHRRARAAAARGPGAPRLAVPSRRPPPADRAATRVRRRAAARRPRRARRPTSRDARRRRPWPTPTAVRGPRWRLRAPAGSAPTSAPSRPGRADAAACASRGRPTSAASRAGAAAPAPPRRGPVRPRSRRCPSGRRMPHTAPRRPRGRGSRTPRFRRRRRRASPLTDGHVRATAPACHATWCSIRERSLPAGFSSSSNAIPVSEARTEPDSSAITTSVVVVPGRRRTCSSATAGGAPCTCHPFDAGGHPQPRRAVEHRRGRRRRRVEQRCPRWRARTRRLRRRPWPAVRRRPGANPVSPSRIPSRPPRASPGCRRRDRAAAARCSARGRRSRRAPAAADPRCRRRPRRPRCCG